MPETLQQAVRVTNEDGKSSTASLSVQRFSEADRTSTALLRLAACWIGAVFGIFLPLLHFVLVPALVLGGPIAAWLAWRRTGLILEGAVPCPTCATPALVEPASEDWPLAARCKPCRSMLGIEKAGA